MGRVGLLVTNNEVEEKLVAELHEQGSTAATPSSRARDLRAGDYGPRARQSSRNSADGAESAARTLTGARLHRGSRRTSSSSGSTTWTRTRSISGASSRRSCRPSGSLRVASVRPRAKEPDSSCLAEHRTRCSSGRTDSGSSSRRSRPTELTHVWLVTDSEDAFAEMRSALDPRL